MNWELAHVDPSTIFPPPGGFVLSVIFLCAAVWVERVRPDLLNWSWTAAVLGLATLTLGWHAREFGAGVAVTMLGPGVLAAVVLPTGATVRALHRMRRVAPDVSLWPQVLAAAAAFTLGTLVVVSVLPVRLPL